MDSYILKEEYSDYSGMKPGPVLLPKSFVNIE